MRTLARDPRQKQRSPVRDTPGPVLGEGGGGVPVPESPVTAARLVSGGWRSRWSLCKHARLLGTSCLWGKEESGPAMPPSAQALGGQGSRVFLGGF